MRGAGCQRSQEDNNPGSLSYGSRASFFACASSEASSSRVGQKPARAAATASVTERASSCGATPPTPSSK